MRRFLFEILGFLCLTALIVAILAVAGASAVQSLPRPTPTLPFREAGCFEAPLTPVAQSGVVGSARLCIRDEAVRPAMRAENLAADAVFTAWFAYFDQPERCGSKPCGIGDLVGADPPGQLARMDALVADRTHRAGLWGDFRDLRLSSNSQVTMMLVRQPGAGSVDNRDRARRLLTLQLPQVAAPSAGAATGGDTGVTVAQAIFAIP
jgi:hypothetical protein